MNHSAKLNLSFYSGKDLYSDGDIENDILHIVKQYTDFTEILSNDNRWPVLYHLSPHRRNILEWFDFNKNSSLLEIGAGCGALTGLFCEKVDNVVAVELSKRRSEIIFNRHKDKANLEIIVGNLNDINFEQQFDYITLIGVLEYAGMFTDTNNPYRDFLRQIRNYLKPNGVLIIAIENKFGLKYWAGAKEDHTNRLFDGIENYLTTNSVKTFGKYELKNLLASAGFPKSEFYYALPDYKIPSTIYSDKYLPRIGQIDSSSPNYDSDRYLLFNEQLAYDNIILNNQFDFFANSFLVFCNLEIVPTIYSKFNRHRLPKYQTETSILLQKDSQLTAIKRAITPQAIEHIKSISSNYELLNRHYNNIGLVKSRLVNEQIIFDHINGKTLNQLLLEATLKRDKTLLGNLLANYINIARTSVPTKSGYYKSNADFFAVFGQHLELEQTEYSEIANIDLCFSNIILDKNNNYHVIDYEWVFDFSIPVNYVIFRSLFYFSLQYNSYLTNFISKNELMNLCNISGPEIVLYNNLELNFQNYVLGKTTDDQVKRNYLKNCFDLKNTTNTEQIKGSKIKAKINKFLNKAKKRICTPNIT
jgi:SAM-dependent methyltransferase